MRIDKEKEREGEKQREMEENERRETVSFEKLKVNQKQNRKK